ncbi:uncharacterized protein Tco025E_05682 [Trypanosoma conorhini]|uniref:Uncharacterized protein n=1 Tax=Trypanosoma conorhini TaxID=83891 RepID=A0A3R7KWN5_9TRYP|nr:uncharacterized protein Tco025E_05682 [Trypanosoma conorhini]RNF14926.1 hypothetical protein Tco025E_05682 [Trypanosoma conorhini]
MTSAIAHYSTCNEALAERRSLVGADWASHAACARGPSFALPCRGIGGEPRGGWGGRLFAAALKKPHFGRSKITVRRSCREGRRRVTYVFAAAAPLCPHAKAGGGAPTRSRRTPIAFQRTQCAHSSRSGWGLSFFFFPSWEGFFASPLPATACMCAPARGLFFFFLASFSPYVRLRGWMHRNRVRLAAHTACVKEG